MDFYRTHRDRMARVIGSPWPQDDILLVSQLMWGDWGGFWRREGRWYRKIEIGAEMGQTRSRGSCGEQGHTCNSEALPRPPPQGHASLRGMTCARLKESGFQAGGFSDSPGESQTWLGSSGIATWGDYIEALIKAAQWDGASMRIQV